jgi:hypothetical protein
MPPSVCPVIKIGPHIYQPTIFRIAFIRFDQAHNLINFAMRGNGGETTQPHFVNCPAAQRMLGKAHIRTFAEIFSKSIDLNHDVKLANGRRVKPCFAPMILSHAQ